MREILFRGKRLNGDGWVCGDLSYHVHNGEVYVFPGDGYDSPDCYEVDPATVGQYTGLQDMNGNKIFEGDIVHAITPNTSKNCIVKCEYGQFCIGLCMPLAYVRNSSKVIGNIHDNPELLEVK